METETVEDVKERVAAGVTWVKEEGPRFGLSLSTLDPRFLDIADPGNCALAQLGAHLNPHADEAWDMRTLTMLQEQDPAGNYGYRWQIDHGFRKKCSGLSMEYAQLTDAWIEAWEAEHLEAV